MRLCKAHDDCSASKVEHCKHQAGDTVRALPRKAAPAQQWPSHFFETCQTPHTKHTHCCCMAAAECKRRHQSIPDHSLWMLKASGCGCHLVLQQPWTGGQVTINHNQWHNPQHAPLRGGDTHRACQTQTRLNGAIPSLDATPGVKGR